MDAERFARIKALFAHVCELPEPDLSQRLQVLAGDDAELIAQVQSLLERERVVTGQFEQPVLQMLGELAVEPVQPGTVLGAWTLHELIGHGGMGSVYRAERSDGHFQQQAAVKLLRGLPSQNALEYLARERQILAGLTHPNIARLLDGGATPSGQPYLVMELLDGVAIDQYCEQRAASVPTILQLLQQVCAAVAFAHQRLVIHCDLKPSNILVDASGRPWLLDFGIARLLDAGQAQGGPSTASLRVRAFTPGFSSPEQAAGEAVGTAADVFSLGRLLQALLGEARLAQHPELAAIVVRATRREPQLRYAGADALADDLARYLGHQPLRALPDRLGYRARKLVQRRWPLLALVALLLLTIAGFTWRLVIDRDRALQAEQSALAERDRATQAETAAKQVSGFLVSVFDGANPDAGSGNIPTSTLVEQALQRIDSELAGQPAVQAELYATLAGVQAVLGTPKSARDSYQRAIRIQTPLGKPALLADWYARLAALLLANFGHAEAEAAAAESLRFYAGAQPADVADLAAARRLLGEIRVSGGQIADGEKLLQQALMFFEAAEPGSMAVARTLEALAGARAAAGDLPAAEALRRRALALRGKAGGTDSADYIVAQAMLARVLVVQGEYAEAEGYLRIALERQRRTAGEEDVSTPWSMAELAHVLCKAGKTTEGLTLYADALVLAERKIGRNTASYAVLLNNTGLAQRDAGQLEAALVTLRRALQTALPLWGEDDITIALFRHNLAALLLDLDKPAEAAALLQLAWTLRLAKLGDQHPDVLASALLLAQERLDRRDLAAAREWLARVTPYWERLQVDLKPRYQRLLESLQVP